MLSEERSKQLTEARVLRVENCRRAGAPGQRGQTTEMPHDEQAEAERRENEGEAAEKFHLLR